MTVWELGFSLLAAFGLVCLVWLAAGWLLLPLRCPVRVVLEACGPGSGLEQGVRALLWLRRTGLWRGSVVIRDEGLDENGLAIARALSRWDGVRLAGDFRQTHRAPSREITQKKKRGMSHEP